MSLSVLRNPAVLTLKAAGFAKPLRLTWLRRRGALEVFAVKDERLEAVRFAPAGVVRDHGGRLVPTPEAAEAYAEAVDAFASLGRRLQLLRPLATPPLLDVMRGQQGCFWLRATASLTLEAWLADNPGPVDPAVVAAFARRLGGALAELHAGGVVHGDLSPGAVVIEDETVKLVGFGVDRRPIFRILRSQEGLVEPGYAPPEAHDGACRRPIGPAADLYAASAILLRLLTGQTPSPANNAAARLAGEDPWQGSPPMQAGLRRGVEAGLALAPEERPPNTVVWLAGLELGPEISGEPWFHGAVSTPPSPPADEPFTIPPPPSAGDGDLTADEAPLAFERVEQPRRAQVRTRALAAAGLVAAGAATAAAVAWLPPPAPRPPVAPSRPAPAPPPAAPAGCQWLGGNGGWRLRCSDEVGGLRLPERFDAETTTRAGAGDVAAMERLGTFYRQRAANAAPANRGAYAYQAYAWLARAADAPVNSRPEDQRPRDDAALALGQMLGRGEGGRATDPAGAEARLRQAAAGSRADAVLTLAQQLEARGDTAKVTEARGLYARVAQLKDGSALQREAAAALARLDTARAVAAPRPPPETAAKPEPKPPTPSLKAQAPKPTASPPASPPPVARTAAAKTSPPPSRAPVRAPAASSPAPRGPAPAPRAATGTPFGVRTWTSYTFLQVDPAANFYPAVELAGRAACAREGGYALSVRNGDVTCPNGVNYCQVRAVATCQSQ